MDDGVIALLNDIGTSGATDEVFLDAEGEPTDLFLQALKSEFPRSGANMGSNLTASSRGIAKTTEDDVFRHMNMSGADETSYRSRRTSSASTTSAATTGKMSISKSQTSTFDRNIEKGRGSSRSVSAVSKGKSTSTTRKGRTSSLSGGKKKKNSNRTRSPSRGPKPSTEPENLVVNRRPAIEVRESKAARVRINAGMRHATEAHRESMERSTGRGVAFTARQGAAKDHVKDRSLSPKRTKNTQEAAAALLMKTRSIRSKDGENDNLRLSEDELNAEIEAAAAEKYRSQQLRIAGQVQTIRALESQLAETLELLEERNRQVQHADARVKAMQKELQRETRRASERVQENAKILESRRGDLLEKFKAQNDLLQSQLVEEQTKNRRANDRVRVLREFGDKCKEKISSLEGRQEEVNKHLADSNKSMQRYRHEGKELSAELASLRKIATEREEEIGRQRARAESAEYSLRNLELDNDRMADEMRAQRKDVFAYQEQLKQCKLEMEIFKQKNATRQTEDVINSIRNRDRSLDLHEHRSNHYQHTHKHVASEEGAPHEEYNPRPQESDKNPPRMNVDKEYADESVDASVSPSRVASGQRHVKPRYTLPKRSTSEVQPLGSRTSATVMSKRASSSRDAAEPTRIERAIPPAPPPEVMRSTEGSVRSLDDILGIESDEEDDGEEGLSLLDDASLQRKLAGSNLRQISESIQSNAKASAKAAEDSLRSSLESLGSDLGDQDMSRLSQNSSIDILQTRMNKLKRLQEKY